MASMKAKAKPKAPIAPLRIGRKLRFEMLELRALMTIDVDGWQFDVAGPPQSSIAYADSTGEGEGTESSPLRQETVVWSHEQISGGERSHPDPINPTIVINGTIRGPHRDNLGGFVEFATPVPEGFEAIRIEGVLDTLGATRATFGKGIHALHPGRGVHIDVNEQRVHTFWCEQHGQYGDYWAENGPFQRYYVIPGVDITPVTNLLKVRVAADSGAVADLHELKLVVTLRSVSTAEPLPEQDPDQPPSPDGGDRPDETPADPSELLAALRRSNAWRAAWEKATISAAIAGIFDSESLATPLDDLWEVTTEAILRSDWFHSAETTSLLPDLSAAAGAPQFYATLGSFFAAASTFAIGAQQLILNGNPSIDFAAGLGEALLTRFIASARELTTPADLRDGLSPEELLVSLAARPVQSDCFYPGLYQDMGAVAFGSYTDRLDDLFNKPPSEQHWVTFAESNLLRLREQGWTPMTGGDLGIELDAEGRYSHWSGGSMQFLQRVHKGELQVLFGITGTDQLRDVAGWISPDVHYLGLQSALSALTAFVDRAQPACVYGSGHSLGGAMLQMYLARMEAPDDDRFRAVTFGSPGAPLHDAMPDERIVHIVSAHDLVGAAGRNTLPALIELAGLSGPPAIAAVTNILSAARDAWAAGSGSPENAAATLRNAVTAFTAAFPTSNPHRQQVERLIEQLLFQPAGGRDQIGHFAYAGPTLIINSDAPLNNLEEHSIARYVHALACLQPADQALLLRDSHELADTTFVTSIPECHVAPGTGGTGGGSSGGATEDPNHPADFQQLFKVELGARRYLIEAVAEALARAFTASQQAPADDSPNIVFIPGLEFPYDFEEFPNVELFVEDLATAIELRLAEEPFPAGLLLGVELSLEEMAAAYGRGSATVNSEAVVQFGASLSRSLLTQFVTPTVRDEIAELLTFIPSDIVAAQVTHALTQVVDEALYQVASSVLSPLAQPLGNAVAGLANGIAAINAYQALNSVFQASNPALLVAAAVSSIAFGNEAPDSDVEALFRSITITGEPVSSILLTAFNFISYIDARRDAAKERRLAESIARDKTITRYIMSAVPAIFAEDARTARLIWTAQADLREAEHEHRGDRQHYLALDAMGVLRDQILERQVAFPPALLVPFSYGGEDGIEIGRNIMAGVALGAGSQAISRLTGQTPDQFFRAREGRSYQHHPEDYVRLMELQKVLLDAWLFVSPDLPSEVGENLIRLPSTVHSSYSASGHDQDAAAGYDGSYETAAMGSVNCAGRGGCGVHLETMHEFAAPAHMMAITAAVQVHSYATGSYIRDHAGHINVYYSSDGGATWQSVPNTGRGYSHGDGDTETQLADVIAVDLQGVTHIKLVVSASGNASGGEGNAGADFEIRDFAVFGKLSGNASEVDDVVSLHDPLLACEPLDDPENHREWIESVSDLMMDGFADENLLADSQSARGQEQTNSMFIEEMAVKAAHLPEPSDSSKDRERLAQAILDETTSLSNTNYLPASTAVSATTDRGQQMSVNESRRLWSYTPHKEVSFWIEDGRAVNAAAKRKTRTPVGDEEMSALDPEWDFESGCSAEMPHTIPNYLLRPTR